MEKLTKKRILLVDDEEVLREALREEFEAAGASVVEAENGKLAYEVFKAQGPFDAIVSDIRMPGGDGIELLGNIRSQDSVRPPVLLLTGYADVTPAEALAKGAGAMFYKPFKMKILLEAMAYLIDHPGEKWRKV